MALLTAPAPQVREAKRAGRLAARARSTPGRLTELMLGLAVLGLLAGLAATVGTVQRSALVDGVGARSGPLTVRAQQLYRALSDADATAASAFLAGGVEPPALRDKYQADVAEASAALAAVTAGNDGDRRNVDLITAQFPVYTGLVETARTYNRLGKPLGAAYLREASGLMRLQLLPAAKQLYQAETDRLRADGSGGAGFPWLAIPLILLTLAGLVLAQRYLTRRTRRLLNLGLAGASLVAVVMLVWTTLVWAGVQSHLDTARQAGSRPVELLAQARIAALQARADESLTLVARGGGAAFDKDFDTTMTDLAGPDGSSGLLAQARDQAQRSGDATVRAAVDAALADTRAWRTAHQKLRGLDNGGDYMGALQLAIGTGQDGTGTASDRLDADLAKGITSASSAFDREAKAAAGTFTGATAGLVVLTLLLLAGVVAGFQQRIAEYR
jgi:hypothetical protein